MPPYHTSERGQVIGNWSVELQTDLQNFLRGHCFHFSVSLWVELKNGLHIYSVCSIGTYSNWCHYDSIYKKTKCWHKKEALQQKSLGL